MTARGVVAAAALIGVGLPAWTDEFRGGVVMQAMRDELARSVEVLQMDRLEKPYFLSYRIDDVVSAQAVANFGALTDKSSTRNRTPVHRGPRRQPGSRQHQLHALARRRFPGNPNPGPAPR